MDTDTTRDDLAAVGESKRHGLALWLVEMVVLGRKWEAKRDTTVFEGVDVKTWIVRRGKGRTELAEDRGKGWGWWWWWKGGGGGRGVGMCGGGGGGGGGECGGGGGGIRLSSLKPSSKVLEIVAVDRPQTLGEWIKAEREFEFGNVDGELVRMRVEKTKFGERRWRW